MYYKNTITIQTINIQWNVYVINLEPLTPPLRWNPTQGSGACMVELLTMYYVYKVNGKNETVDGVWIRDSKLLCIRIEKLLYKKLLTNAYFNNIIPIILKYNYTGIADLQRKQSIMISSL